MIFSPHDSPSILVFTADARFVGGSHPSCLKSSLFDVLQMWDIRDGMCKQTFTGHESDINAITVRSYVSIMIIMILVNIILVEKIHDK